MKGKVDTDFKKQTEKWDEEFYVWFTIKADRTKENESVQKGFKDFCKTETDNNYTQGLRKLLEFYEEDWKYESLHKRIENLEEEVAQVRNGCVTATKKVEQDKDKETF